MLFQGFDAPAIVSQKRPEIPKAKQDEQPIPVAIIEVEDKDLLNFMSGGLTVRNGCSAFSIGQCATLPTGRDSVYLTTLVLVAY